METKIRVLIADADEQFRALLANSLSSTGDFTVIAETPDGAQAAELCGTLLPDVVVADNLLQNLDGLELMEKLGRLREKPLTVLTSAIMNAYVTACAAELNVDYMVLKP